MTFIVLKIILKEKKRIMVKDNEIIKLIHLSIQDLVNYEKAACIVCRKYENMIRDYNGMLNSYSHEYEKFEHMNMIHNQIINEIEERLNKLA